MCGSVLFIIDNQKTNRLTGLNIWILTYWRNFRQSRLDTILQRLLLFPHRMLNSMYIFLISNMALLNLNSGTKIIGLNGHAPSLNRGAFSRVFINVE